MLFAPWLVLRVAACPTLVLLVGAACPTIVRRAAACPTLVLRCPLALDVVLRVAALPQAWLARVAARAASARRCLAEQFFLRESLCPVSSPPVRCCHMLVCFPFSLVTC